MIRENEEMEKLNDQEESKYLAQAKDNVEKHKDDFKISQLDALLSKAGMYRLNNIFFPPKYFQ